MQLFIGGASAGKHDAVKQRFPSAVWWRLAPGQRLHEVAHVCLLYTSPSPRDKRQSRMPSSA